VLARIARVTTAAGRAAILAAEGVTAAEAAVVLAAAGVAYGTYRAAKYVKKNAPTWKSDARADGRVPGSTGRPWMPQGPPGSRPRDPENWGNQDTDTPGSKRPAPNRPDPPQGSKRPRDPENWGNQDTDTPVNKRPGRPVHHHEGWMPLDNNIFDDQDMPDDPAGPDPTDWSGNPGTHNTHALRNGDSTSCTSSAARFRSSGVRVTRPTHVGQLSLRHTRGCPRSARSQRSIGALACRTRYAPKRAAPALSAAPQAPCASTVRRCPWVPACAAASPGRQAWVTP
jgi:hypothetical protein